MARYLLQLTFRYQKKMPCDNVHFLRNECLFFSVHGKWIAVRNKQIAWTAKRFSCDLFVPHCDSFHMNREKKDTHSLYLQCLQQKSLLKFSEQSKKFKFPSEIGNMTLFPDKTIHACHTTRIPSAGPPSAPFQPIRILIGRRELQE